MSNNKKIGNSFEERLSWLLFKKGFWVHRFAQNADGQPTDILAARGGNSYLIDCKVCSDNTFAISRMEENQKHSMDLWFRRGNGSGWFALELNNGEIYMIRHMILISFSKSLTLEDIKEVGYTFENWCELW